MNNWFAPKMEGEVSHDEILQKAENGDFHAWNYEAFDFREYGYEDVMNKLKSYSAEEYAEYEAKVKAAKASGNTAEAEKYQAKMDSMVDEVYQIYKSKGIYPTVYFSELGVMEEIERCISYKAYWDGDTVSCGAGMGTTLCKFLFPNLQDTPSKHDLDKKGAESIFAKFNNEQYLKRAIKFCFSYKNGCPIPTAVEGGLRLVGSAPSNFRPMNAKAIYERFTPKGGVIYDFCCVRGDTEYFNGREWKPIRDYVEGDKVLQYTGDGKGVLTDPIEYIHYQSNAPFYNYTSENLDSSLTGNHDVVLESSYGEITKVKQDEIVGKSESFGIVPTTFKYKGISNGDTVAKSSMYLAILLYFHGSFKKTTNGYSITVAEKHLLSEIVQYLVDNDVPRFEVKEMSSYTDKVYTVFFDWYKGEDFLYKNEKGEIRFTQKFLSNLLGMPEYWEFFYEMVVKWGRVRIPRERSTEEDEGYVVDSGCADVLQLLLAGNGECVVKSERYGGVVFLKICNTPATYVGDRFTIEEDPDKYCFTVPSHMLILRYNGKIFITGNCGFGGRMLGALSSTNDYKYVGTDPNTETMYHLHQLGEYIEQVTGREDSYELHCCGSEDFRGKENSIDFSFSSPPYFDLEVYSDEPTQCYNKFPTLEGWLEGYVRQTIKNIIYMLKPGRCYAVNIADFTVGSGGTVAYVDEWIRLSTEEGAPLFDTVYLGVTARAGSKEQAAGELKKENILVFKKPI